MPVQCSYCGGTHPDAQSVRACWNAARPQPSAGEAPPPLPGNAPPPAPGNTGEFLGRSVLVEPGAAAPGAWSGCPRVRPDAMGEAEALAELEQAYIARRRLVIEVEPGWEQQEAESVSVPPWSLGPEFRLAGERLRHAACSNSLDAREIEPPSWAWSSEAVGLGSAAGGPADVVLGDGTPAYIDGGPLAYPGGAAPRGAVVIPRVTVEHGRLTPFGSNGSAAELAPDQLAAVTHPGGSARILAPAGSGKTRVLTERARHLLKAWRIPPEALCLVAFNKRAADEIRERTTDLPGLQVRTLNSLGLAILSSSGRFGSGRPVETIDEPGVRHILEGLVSFPRRAGTDPAAAWIEALSAVRLGLRSPERVEAEFQGDVDGLAEVFVRYREVLQSRGVVDFDEQIYRAIAILLADPRLRHQARMACRVMLVDEFQDLTPAHLLLIRLLAGPEGSVYGVGDDDQTIYGYAGASPRWLIDYQSFFPGAGTHLLKINYRCPPGVVSAARTLLSHNRTRVEKVIEGPPGRDAGGGGGAGLRVEEGEDPVAATVAAVAGFLQDGAEPAAVAVLTRVNSSLAPVQLSLIEAGVPVNRAVDARFLERTGVRAALGWLNLAVNPGRLRAVDVSFTARRPPRALSPKVIEWMSEQRSLERIRSLADRLGDRDAGKVNNYADDVERLAAEGAEGTTESILRCLRDEVGLAAAMSALDTEHRRLDRSPQTDDLDALIALGSLHPDPVGFEAWLREGLGRPGDPDGVTLATIHAVKGREWDRVVVHHATSGLIPHRLAADVEEERRVYHVAITRCRSETTVVAGSPRSAFVDEMFRVWAPGAEPVPSPKPAVRAAHAAAPVPGSQSERASRLLRAWRLEKSRSEGKPAYTVFHDSTLEAIAASGARSLSELGRIKGVGPAKLENFGDEILAVLDAAVETG